MIEQWTIGVAEGFWVLLVHARLARSRSQSMWPRIRRWWGKLPRELPVSLPSELVHRRPDILAAEAQLHAATAAVGIATANLYPQITLTATGGQQALPTTAWQLFDPFRHGVVADVRTDCSLSSLGLFPILAPQSFTRHQPSWNAPSTNVGLFRHTAEE
jgi:Outer membrane efflux protein